MMQTGKKLPILIWVALLLFSSTILDTAVAYDTIQKPHSFIPGAPAKASEVNENFDVLYERVNTLSAEIHDLNVSTFNCIAVNTLKEAYLFAQQHFIDNPQGIITMEVLIDEGLNLPDGVDLTIQNGAMATLLMSARHINTGKIYSIDNKGAIIPDDDFSSLATSYITLLTGQWERSYNSIANSAVKNAYTAAQAYYIDYPDASITLLNLQEAGYQAPENVTITIKAAKMENLLLTASHARGNKLYIVDRTGIIISENTVVGDKMINDLLNAYTAAQSFFQTHPDANITYNDLLTNGFQPSEGVVLTVVGTKNTLLIEATHPESGNICKINHAGVISLN